ncbi:hypothetical protein [Streptomyces sp. NPDC048411]|uniref:hypothetical protein n=1 Tax=Streptomyces sp. NPDC048411 TaxID=3157206 RepID=UPI0034520BC9
MVADPDAASRSRISAHTHMNHSRFLHDRGGSFAVTAKELDPGGGEGRLVASSPGGPFGAKLATVQKGDIVAGAAMQVLLASVGSFTFAPTAEAGRADAVVTISRTRSARRAGRRPG